MKCIAPFLRTYFKPEEIELKVNGEQYALVPQYGEKEVSGDIKVL